MSLAFPNVFCMLLISPSAAVVFSADMSFSTLASPNACCPPPPPQEAVVFNVNVVSANSGGLIGNLMGLEVFIPNPHICRRPGLSLDEVRASLALA